MPAPGGFPTLYLRRTQVEVRAVATRIRLSVSEILGSMLTTRFSAPMAGPRPALQLTTDRRAYHPGEQGAIIIRNDGSRIVRLSSCRRQLEQQQDGAWLVRERWPGPDEPGTTASVLLPPGATGGTGFRLPRGLAAGTYRWRFVGIGEQPAALPGNSDRLTNNFVVET